MIFFENKIDGTFINQTLAAINFENEVVDWGGCETLFVRNFAKRGFLLKSFENRFYIKSLDNWSPALFQKTPPKTQVQKLNLIKYIRHAQIKLPQVSFS